MCGPDFRYCAGGMPKTALNARVNNCKLLYPDRPASPAIGIDALARKPAA